MKPVFKMCFLSWSSLWSYV